MREVPELTFRGALGVLGHYDRPVIDRLNTLLGGVIMVGGAVSLTGPVAAPAMALAAIWGWVDQKNEAVDQVRKLLDRIGEHRASARGFDRTRLITAAHTILVASSVVDAFRHTVGDKTFKDLELTDKELAELLVQEIHQRVAEVMYESAVPKPSAMRGYAENLADVREWQGRFAHALYRFSRGLAAGETLPEADISVTADSALRRYEDQYRKFAAQVPEFLVWTLLTEFAAARELVADAREDVRQALDVQVRAMSRLEALLQAMAGAMPDQVTALRHAAKAGLELPVVGRDATSGMLADIRFPLVRDIFVQPGYRIEHVDERSRIADDQWWQTLPRRDDLDLRLAAHLTSPEAAHLPLLVLGHPGAGKSLLMNVLAARLPSDQYTTVYAPLRHVSSTVPVYEQVEQALRLATNGRVDWAGLVRQSRNTTLVVLLDGLDEMLQASDRDRVSYLHDVADFQWREMTQGLPVVVLVTARTLVADRVDVPSGTTVVNLAEFNTEQIEQWRAVWNTRNRSAIDEGRVRELTKEAVDRQHELAQQPLLLLMLAVYSADPSFPAIESSLSKTALYRTLFENFTRREATKVPDGAPQQDQLKRLSVAALGMFNRGRQHITDVELAADLAVLDADGASQAEPGQRLVTQFFFVHSPEANRGTDRARRTYEFLHATFGEFLVAREVVDTLVETADSTVTRRGTKKPLDDRLFALLSHDCLAVRGPVLGFIRDLLAELPDDRERITETILTLLADARHRSNSAEYANYRPIDTDHVRAIAAYTANLVLLVALVDRGIEVPRPTFDLWRAGLTTDSWYALLAALERDRDRLFLSGERPHSTGLEAEIRYAELTGDSELHLTLRMGHTIRRSALPGFELTRFTPGTDADRAARGELFGWLVSVLAFGNETAMEMMHEDRLAELLEVVSESRTYQPMIAMVLKQRADRLPMKIVSKLVAFLLNKRSQDSYAFIAAVGAHPGLMTDFPQLRNVTLYADTPGSALMLRGIVASTGAPRLHVLLDSFRPVSPAAAAAALLAAFQWRVEH